MFLKITLSKKKNRLKHPTKLFFLLLNYWNRQSWKQKAPPRWKVLPSWTASETGERRKQKLTSAQDTSGWDQAEAPDSKESMSSETCRTLVYHVNSEMKCQAVKTLISVRQVSCASRAAAAQKQRNSWVTKKLITLTQVIRLFSWLCSFYLDTPCNFVESF